MDPHEYLNEKYERRKNVDIEKLYNKPNIGKYLKARPMEWAGHVWQAGGSFIRYVLTKKINKKRDQEETPSRMDR